MRQSVRVTVAGMVLLGALIPAGCMVLDALGPTGPRGVTFAYVGATDLSVDQPSAFQVTVLAQGVPLPPQRLRLAIIPDSTKVTLNATGDSLLPCRAGQASLLVQLLHSSASGTGIPDTSIVLHVTGGGPPGARCP
jgi:hypothetical protein